MLDWTPPMSPEMTFTVSGNMIDAGETCVNARRLDGTAVDPTTFQDLYEEAVGLNRLLCLVQNTLNASNPGVGGILSGDYPSNSVTVTVAAASVTTVQATINTNFPGQNVSVVSG